MNSRYVLLIISLFTLLILLSGWLLWQGTRPLSFGEGSRIGGLSVSGLTLTQAEARLRARERELNSNQVLLQVRGREASALRGEDYLSWPWRKAFGEARARLEAQSWLERARSGGKISGQWNARLSADSHRLGELVRRTSAQLAKPPVEGRMVLTSTGPDFQPGQPGQRLGDRVGLVRQLRAALLNARPLTVRGNLKRVHPRVHTRAQAARLMPTSLVVDLSSTTARLYKGFKLRKSYRVADGMPGHPTPRGLFSITGKQVNPVWSVPNSPWAGELAGQTIPPGAGNPLLARWIGITDGVGFHGTPEPWTIGTHASHGCLRMRVPDVKDLYPRVPLGTPILIKA